MRKRHGVKMSSQDRVVRSRVTGGWRSGSTFFLCFDSARFSTLAGPPVGFRYVVITEQLGLVFLLIIPEAKPVRREPHGTKSLAFARAAPPLRRDGPVKWPQWVYIKDSIQRFRVLFKGHSFLHPRL